MTRKGNDHQRTRLSGTSYAILGLVALRGPSTAYDLRRAIGRLSGEYWAIPHAMAYHETRRLEQASLLTAEQEGTGRKRRVFALSPMGRAALERWLAEPDDSGMAIRDIAQLQLLFAELDGGAHVAALAQSQVQAYSRRIAEIDRTEAQLAGRGLPATRTRQIALGRGVYEAARQFWQELASTSLESVPAPLPSPSARPGDGERADASHTSPHPPID